jgi:hypothetical protein
LIHLALFIVLVLTSGCASSTAMISQSANTSREAAAQARAYLVKANDELARIEALSAQISAQIPYVSDDVPAIFSTLQYVSVAVVAAVIGALIYTYIPRGR